MIPVCPPLVHPARFVRAANAFRFPSTGIHEFAARLVLRAMSVQN